MRIQSPTFTPIVVVLAVFCMGALHCSRRCPSLGPVVEQTLFQAGSGSRTLAERVVLRARTRPPRTAFDFRGVDEAHLYGCKVGPHRSERQQLPEPEQGELLGEVEGAGRIVVQRRGCVVVTLAYRSAPGPTTVRAITDLGRVIGGGRGQGHHGQMCAPPWEGWRPFEPYSSPGWADDSRSIPRTRSDGFDSQ